MACQLNGEEVAEARKDLLALDYGISEGKYTPEGLINYLHNEMGIPKEVLEKSIYRTPKTVVAELSDKVAADAAHVAGEIETIEGREGIINSFRKRIRDALQKTISSMPTNLNAVGQRLFKGLASENQSISVGKTASGKAVFAGAAEQASLRGDFDALHKSIGKTLGLSRDQAEEGALVLGFLRGKNVPAEIAKAVKQIESGTLPKGKEMLIKKQVLPMLESAKKMTGNAEVEAFMKDYFERLDTVKARMIEDGIFTDEKIGGDNYFHNILAMTEHKDPFDQLIFGKDISVAQFYKGKVFDNGLEAMMEGYVPTAKNFTDIAGNYWKQVGRALKKTHMADELAANAKLGFEDARKMKIGDEPAFIMKDMEDPKWRAPEGYKEVDYSTETSNFKAEGVYAHKDAYKWIANMYTIHKDSGFFKTYRAIDGFLKGTILSLDFAFHGKSLGTAALNLGTTFGIKGFWRLPTIMGEGLSAVTARDATYIKLVQNGFGIRQPDFFRSKIFNTEYNLRTGDKTIRTKLTDSLHAVSSISHKYLFEKWHMGLKVGMAKRIAQSEWFEGMITKGGGGELGEKYAYQALASIMNDAMGARNLETLGRNKTFQAGLQAVLLAPDWKEAKISRIMRSALSDDPNVRRVLQKSLAIEAAFTVTSHAVVQYALGQMYPEMYRSIEDQVKDFYYGHVGDVWMGQTKDGRDKWMRMLGSENEDMRWAFKLGHEYKKKADEMMATSGIFNRMKMLPGAIASPMAKEALLEGSYGLAPLAGLAKKTYENITSKKKAGPSTWEGLTTKGVLPIGKGKPYGVPSPFEQTGVPIPLSPMLTKMRGEEGGKREERFKTGLKATAQSMAAFPVTLTKSKKEEEKTHLKTLKKLKTASSKPVVMAED